ncbi:MAG: single-stranded-DNA-specific exonuclease RecJ [Pyrinomonadaceae bacterium]|nr:single-stranded-DNA-specific exonuclease RecJ [Pyrinomonadaceae bacterium]
MKKRWTIRKHDADAVNKLAAEISVKPLIAALLIARGHDTAEKAIQFLNPSPEHLHEPFLLKGMREAVDRIQKAVDAKEKIMIWGDYDVDGTTGTVLLRKMLSLLGVESTFHVPNRFTEGYGINIPALEQAQSGGVTLVISVDCGIRSFEPLEWASDHGLDVIVTDHHLSDEVRGNPPAVAVVNPNQTGCGYPDKNLAGVGVAFKLAHALLRENELEHEVPQFLKIAAIGTVADVMNLTGENRAIVSLGLLDLTKTDNFGLKALMEISDCRSDMTSMHIGFRIGPRINAAGRMDVARHVVELFEATDFSKARELATLLDSRNRERQKVQQEITELALLETGSHDGRFFVVVAGDGWHQGVIGLAASRIAEKLYRPTIVLSLRDGFGHGSARSIANFHLLNALDVAEELFEQYGGHAAAAGMKIKLENIADLREKLNEYAAKTLTEQDLIPELKIDALLTSRSLTIDLVDELSGFEPFGAGNPKPIFVTRDLVLRDEPFVMKDKHLKLKLLGEDQRVFEAVWWDGVERSKGQTLKPNSRIELAYVAEANVWQGNRRLQLVVEDLRADN